MIRGDSNLELDVDEMRQVTVGLPVRLEVVVSKLLDPETCK